MALVGLHRFLPDRRGQWLALFAVCWPLQALSNGYFMLYGALLIACWLLYFCTTRGEWRPGAVILGVWAVSTLMLLKPSSLPPANRPNVGAPTSAA